MKTCARALSGRLQSRAKSRHQEVEGESELLLGEVALASADLEQAELWFKRSLTLCREAADRRGEANALRWLGRCDLFNGDLVTARGRLTLGTAGLQVLGDVGRTVRLPRGLCRLRASRRSVRIFRAPARFDGRRETTACSVHAPSAARAIQSLERGAAKSIGKRPVQCSLERRLGLGRGGRGSCRPNDRN